jgi:uncharacterized protein YegP (UPF0339 family)
MRTLLVTVLLCVAGISLAAGSRVTLSAASASPTPQGQTVSCDSDDMRRHYCEVDTRGGVRLIKQNSNAACIVDQSWGYDRRGIWVDHGCRADFEVLAVSAYPAPQGQTISCNSDDMRRHYCEVDTRGGVRLIKQNSNAACIVDRSWGYDRRGIWVDRGCRADFEVSAASDVPTPQGQTFSCNSDDMRRHHCDVDTRGGVRLIKQNSNAACIVDRSWGYDRQGIWVDHGCRADFEVGNARWNGWDSGYNIYCASDDGRRHVCPTDTSGGVRLIRQRSNASCDLGRSWGYNDRGVWVDRGCRADFQIGSSDDDDRWRRGEGEGRGNRGGVIYCASDDMKHHACPADTRRGVRLIRQRSDADCIFERTWGYTRNEIWVDRGCRADFQVGNFR